MTQQYFEESPSVASDPKKVTVAIAGTEYVFTTDRGVFAYEKVDKATRILLDVFHEKFYGPSPIKVVDVGCGYGVIACSLADRFESASIVGVEPNERARELTKLNYESNIGDARLIVVSPDDVEGIAPDLIVSNPPIRIGKEALHDLLASWASVLKPGGQMWLVIAKNLGADSTAVFLEEKTELSVKRVASKKGFRVLVCSRPSSG